MWEWSETNEPTFEDNDHGSCRVWPIDHGPLVLWEAVTGTRKGGLRVDRNGCGFTSRERSEDLTGQWDIMSS